MIGFTAKYAGGEIERDPSEIEEAGWFGPDNLPPRLPGKISIARKLIDWYIEKHSDEGHGKAPREGTGSGVKDRLHEIIFEADTPAGKLFDVLLIASILLSVLAVMLDTISPVREAVGGLLYGIEWFFTLVFTVEYLLRLYAVRDPSGTRRVFWGSWISYRFCRPT